MEEGQQWQQIPELAEVISDYDVRGDEEKAVKHLVEDDEQPAGEDQRLHGLPLAQAQTLEAG